MAENKKSASGWGGRRKGSGAKRTLPPGARTRSVKMTDEELLKVKKILNESRRNKAMFKLYGMKDVKKGILFNIEGSPNGVIAVATALKPGLNERVEIIDDRYRTRCNVYVSTEPPANSRVKKSMIGETVLIGSGNDLNDLKEIETYGLVRINIYKTSEMVYVHVEELDTGAITVTGEGTDWDIEENNGRFKNINDYIDCFVRNKENVKSVKRISNDTIEIVWYDVEFKGYMMSKHQFCVTNDLIGTVTLDMDVVRKNDVDKA